MKKRGKRPKPARKSMHAQFAIPRWKMLSRRLWKTDLGGDLPEVVILILSNEEFRKFHASTAAAKRYIDDHHFLKRKLIKVVFVNRSPNDDGTQWLVVISHTIESTAAVLAYQI
ncbi:MAG TPA: hypothetical protein VGR84_09125 [Candidatus Acidoferrales bacterium]|nr:hypothetical protein [Candidatus Acidoferrales bacterium]